MDWALVLQFIVILMSTFNITEPNHKIQITRIRNSAKLRFWFFHYRQNLPAPNINANTNITSRKTTENVVEQFIEGIKDAQRNVMETNSKLREDFLQNIGLFPARTCRPPAQKWPHQKVIVNGAQCSESLKIGVISSEKWH